MENMCIWEENPRGQNDWYFVSCINKNVNPWKVAKKNNLTMVQLFLQCPYCGKKIKPIFKNG
mgnify:FL=1